MGRRLSLMTQDRTDRTAEREKEMEKEMENETRVARLSPQGSEHGDLPRQPPVDRWAEERRQFARFQSDVAAHRVEVLRDDGLYRHLRCSDGTYNMRFDVVTWPGYICYSGDMGCFVFTRLPDMFEFFRGRDGAVIDRGYLAEKAVAADKHDGIRRFSRELFEAAVREDFEQFADDMSPTEKAELWERVDYEVLGAASDGEESAVRAAVEFTHPEFGRDARSVFDDFYEHRLEDYTERFWWCCYAIPWAIEHYDAAQVSKDSEAG